MTVKILIKRKVKHELIPSLDMLLRQLRAITVTQPGYISGESFKRLDTEGIGQVMVISTWQTIDDWRKWFNSQTRKELQDEIDVMLGEQTEYEAYQSI